MSDLSPEGLEAAERLLAQARAGEDVSAELGSLSESDQARVRTVLESQQLVLGLPVPGGGLAGLPPQLEARLEIVRKLGRGGMGVVYLARERQGGREVVVKVLPPDLAWNPRLLTRFVREGQALLKLPAHPNLVRVFEAHAEPQPCLVMEFVSGRSLDQVLQRDGALPVAEALRIARDLASGLAAIHRQGLVHRDLKPGNVMLTAEGQVKLIDFGLAKDVFLSTITKAGAVMGSCHYMAPEQWAGERQDARCDVFALGATLYALLVGRPPFYDDDPSEVRDMALAGDYEPLSEARADAPAELELVLAGLLTPSLRYRTGRMERVVEDLDAVLRGEPSGCPALLEEGGAGRLPLLPGKRWTVGRGEGCDLVLANQTVSGEHAEVRREASGYTLVDLKSSYGTFVGGEKLTRPRSLQDGDRIRLGDVRLVVRDPGSAAAVPVHLEDVRRVEAPDWVLQLLVERGDPRVLAALLETLAPDPQALDRAAREVASVLGESVAARVRDWLADEQHAAQQRSGALLAAASGERYAEAADWLSWWAQRGRAQFPLQVVPAGVAPTRVALLHGADRHELGDAVTLIGRDPSCRLVLEDPSVSRRHATVLRLNTRLLLHDAGSNAGTRRNGEPVRATFLQAGDRLDLGDARVQVVALGEPPTTGLEPAAFRALVALRHPSVARALGAMLQPGAADDAAARAGASLAADEALQEALVARARQRAQAAARILTELSGRATTELGAWAAAQPGPQVDVRTG